MIEVDRVTKRYGSTLALDQLSFQVKPGRVTGFLGPNGAGKSTTMRVILGLDSPTHGTALVAGRPYPKHRHPMHEIGSLLEAKSVHQGRSAFHHLLCLAHSNGIPKRRVHEVIEMVGLTSVAKKCTGGFSSGMSQRLGIAQALLGDPPIVMLDEPINGLDPEGIRWVRKLLKNLAAEGRTVFVSSHLMSEMSLMAEHLIMIGHERLIADTNTDEFVACNRRDHVRVRTPQPTELAAFMSFFAGQAFYATQGVAASLDDEGVLRAVIGAGLYLTASGIFGLAVGALLRNTAVALIVTVAALFIVPELATLLPGE